MSCLISQECHRTFGKIVDVVKNERIYIDADVSIPFNMDSAIDIDDRRRAGIKFIVNDTRELFTSPQYKEIHKTIINAFLHTQKTKTRLPSFLMTWELFKNSFKTTYTNASYETYINEPDDTNVVDLERDETKRICSCGNPPPHHINELFKHMTEQSKNEKPPDADILTALSSNNNWKFLNPYDHCIKLFYDVTYRNKKYFITYNLVHIYFIDYKAILPQSQHIRASKAIYDPILTLLLTSDMKLYNAMKHFLKVGYYYISVSTHDPRTPSGVNDVYTHPMSFYQYIEKIPNYEEMITLPKLKMVLNPHIKPRRISPRQDNYDEIQYLDSLRFRQKYPINCRNDFETVIIEPTATRPVRYYKNTIPTIQLTHSHADIRKRPDRIPSVISPPEPTYKNSTFDVIGIHAGITSDKVGLVSQTRKKPMPNITADPNVIDIPSLKTMIINCYKTNPKFQETADAYENIKIVKGIHFDQCRSIKSRHFNIIFFTAGKECTPVYHAYISNNTIVSITAIINMLI